MILRYIIGAILVLVVMIVQFCFSWWIALFVKSDGTYPYLLKVFQPYDTLAIGDQMFLDNEMAYTKKWHWWFRNYWCAFNWGQRNAGYGAMGYTGFKTGRVTWYAHYGKDVDIGDHGYTIGTSEATAINDTKVYFNYKRAGRLSKNYGWMVEFGWVLKGIKARMPGEICRLCLDVRPIIKLMKA